MPIDLQRFDDAKSACLTQGAAGIGTLGEKTLHAVLKEYYCTQATQKEIKIGPHIVDLWDGRVVTEIQTRSFDRLRGKLEALLPMHTVRVVYPVPRKKWLLWIDETSGAVTKKRLSPKRGSAAMAFGELYKIKQYLAHPNLGISIVLIDLEEFRFLNGWSDDRKRGSTRFDRMPVSIAGEVNIYSPADWLQMLPTALPQRFTSKDFKAAAGTSAAQAGVALNVLTFVKAVRRVGKTGNAIIYERNAI